MHAAPDAATPHSTGLLPQVRENFPDNGSSMLATTRTASSVAWQVSMSILNALEALHPVR